MNIRRAAARASIAALLPFAGIGAGAERAGASRQQRRSCEREIEEQKQRLLILERKLEIQQEAATAAAATAPRITASASRFQIGFDRRLELRAPARHVARRRAHLRRRLGAGNRRHLHPAARAPDLRRHLRQHLRLQVHAGLRRRPHRSSSMPTSRRASIPRSHRDRRQVQAAGGSRAPAELGGHPLHRARAARPTSSRTATSVVQLSGDFERRRLQLPGGLLQRRHRRPEQRQPRDAGRGSGHRRRLRRAPLLPAVPRIRATSACAASGSASARTWVDVDGTAANTALAAYRSPGQQSIFAYRANTATGVTPNNATFADGERLRLAPQLYYYRGSFGVSGRIHAGRTGRVARHRRRDARQTR